jgi:hypothetical protein
MVLIGCRRFGRENFTNLALTRTARERRLRARMNPQHKHMASTHPRLEHSERALPALDGIGCTPSMLVARARAGVTMT